MRGRRPKPSEGTRGATLDRVGHAVKDFVIDQLPGGALLKDHEGWDPVVPPDLHTIRPAKVDADGNVACIQCAKPTPFAQAELVGAEGFVCRACARTASLAAPVRARRSNLPWLVGALLLASAGIAVAIVMSRDPGDEEEPKTIVISPDLETLARYAAEARAREQVPEARHANLRAEPPWLVIEEAGYRPIRVDTRVLDRVDAVDEDGPHLVMAWGDLRTGLADPAGLDHARELAAALRPPPRGKQRRAGPRILVGEDAVVAERGQVRIGRSAFMYAGVCTLAEAGKRLVVARAEHEGEPDAEISAALLFLVLRSESPRALCDWERG